MDNDNHNCNDNEEVDDDDDNDDNHNDNFNDDEDEVDEEEDEDSDTISLKGDASLNLDLDIMAPNLSNVIPDIDNETMNSFDEEDFLSASYAKKCDILIADDDDVLACTDILNCAEKRNTYASIAKKYELELRQHTSRKRRRKISIEKSTYNNYQQQQFYHRQHQTDHVQHTNYLEDHLQQKIENEQRFSTHFYNILERAQQEIVRLKSK